MPSANYERGQRYAWNLRSANGVRDLERRDLIHKDRIRRVRSAVDATPPRYFHGLRRNRLATDLEYLDQTLSVLPPYTNVPVSSLSRYSTPGPGQTSTADEGGDPAEDTLPGSTQPRPTSPAAYAATQALHYITHRPASARPTRPSSAPTTGYGQTSQVNSSLLGIPTRHSTKATRPGSAGLSQQQQQGQIRGYGLQEALSVPLPLGPSGERLRRGLAFAQLVEGLAALPRGPEVWAVLQAAAVEAEQLRAQRDGGGPASTGYYPSSGEPV